MDNKKIDIKSLLEQNDIHLTQHEREDNLEEKVSTLPKDIDRSKIENANSNFGVEVDRESMEKTNLGVKGGGVVNRVISAESMASIEETLREMEEETEKAKAEFEEFQRKQKAEAEHKAKVEEAKAKILAEKQANVETTNT